MLEMFDFTVLQTRYVKAAADQIPSYRPDGLNPAEIQAQLTAATPVRTDYVTKQAAINAARAGRRDGVARLHDGCVDFFAQARSRYRKDAVTSDLLAKLPNGDETFQQTLTRADSIAALWAGLPALGTPPVAFTFAQGAVTVSLADFTALRTATAAADAAIPTADQAFQKAEADLHAMMDGLEDFVTAALAQGRSQYAEGTPEREIIDAVPTEPAQQPPAQAIISAAVAGAGSATLTYGAQDATSYAILHRPPGATAFTPLADDLIATTYAATGLAAGAHGFQVIGQNSRGSGPTSVTTVVQVL